MSTVILDRSQDELFHHGVKGMKWGVRKDDKTGGNGKVGDGEGGAIAVIAIGAAYVALLIGAATANHRDSGSKNAKKTMNVAWKKNPELAKKMSVDDIHSKVVKPINPNFGAKGTTMNCRRCTFAYEMRRRGLDVKATPSKYASGQHAEGLNSATNQAFSGKAESLWGQKQISSPGKLRVQDAESKSKDIYKALGENPNGSRGELGMGWKMGGGHSMAWEVVKGKPVIFDTQSGITYKDPKSFERFAGTLNDAAYTRLDTLSLNDAFIRRWTTNV